MEQIFQKPDPNAIVDEAMVNAKYYIRAKKKSPENADYDIWVISPVNQMGADADVEAYDIKVKKASKEAEKLKEYQTKIVNLIFDRDPTESKNVNLIGVEKDRNYQIGLSSTYLKKKGYAKFQEIEDDPTGKTSAIIPFSEELENAVHANGHSAVFAAQLRYIKKIKDEQKDRREHEAHREAIRSKYGKEIEPKIYPESTSLEYLTEKTVREGINKEIFDIENKLNEYKDNLNDVLITKNMPEGWNDRNLYFAQFADNETLIKNVIPELLRKVDNKDPENRKNLIKVIETHLDKNSIDAEKFLDEFGALNRSERADIPLLLLEKDSSKKALNISILQKKLLDIEKADSSGEILTHTLKVVNEVGKDGADLMLGIKEELKMQVGDDIEIRETTRQKLDDFFGVGGWNNETLLGVKKMNGDIFKSLLLLDDNSRIKVLGNVEKITELELARTNFKNARDLFENGKVSMPLDVEDYLGRSSEVFNMNYKTFREQPGHTEVFSKLNNEEGKALAQNIVDMYSQKALYDKMTAHTYLTFAEQQIKNVRKGILAAPNPHEFKQVGKHEFEPTEEMLDNCWQVSQAAGCQVLAQLSQATFDKRPNEQYINETLQEKFKENMVGGDICNNIEMAYYMMDKDANYLDKGAKPGEPTNSLTSMSHMHLFDFGPVDNRLIKERIPAKYKAGAGIVGLLAGGVAISTIEGLDAEL